MLSSPQTVPRAASEARLVRQLRSVRGSGARASKPAPTGQSRRPAAPARSARLRWQASRRQCRRRETRYKDPVILQSQGQVSRLLVRGIDIIVTQRHELGEMLKGPGAFLDVGTGVGWLAIEAARSWPALRVLGIDPWEPALTLARQNLAQSGVAERIELRLQRVEQFEEATTFTVAWLPGPFISGEIADRALERVYRALVPGGWLVFGFNPLPHGPLEEALA